MTVCTPFELANGLLDHHHGDLEAQLESAVIVLLRAADIRAQQASIAAGSDDFAAAGISPVLRVLIEDYGAANVRRLVDQIAAADDGEADDQ